MRHVRFAVFAAHPVEHLAAPRIVEVGIYIGQRDTVGVEETLKQEVIFQWVEIGDMQTVGYYGTRSRTTPRTHAYAKFLTRTADKVHHDKEISREAHCLHYVQFEQDTVHHLALPLVQRRRVPVVVIEPLRVFQERLQLGVALLGAVPCEKTQVFRFKLDTVHSIIPAEVLETLLRIFLAERVLPVLIGHKLMPQVLLRVFLSYLVFSSEVFRDVKQRHNRSVVYIVNFHFVRYLLRVCQCLRNVREYGIHLLGCLEPLLFCVVHAVHIVHIVVRAEANQSVVCLGVLFLHKMRVVGADYLHTMFVCQVYQYRIHLFLFLIHILVASWLVGLVALQLDIVILTEHRLKPLYRLLRPRDVACHNLLRQLAAQARRRADDTLVKLLQQVFVNTAGVVESIGHESRAHNLAQVVIAGHVLCQKDQVPA